jgi:hypothetical protein
MTSPNDLIGIALYTLFGETFTIVAALITACLVAYIILTTLLDAWSGKTTSPKEGG